MTRRDYLFITTMFRECKELALNSTDETIIDGVVAHFAAGLRIANPSFDVERFVEASQIEEAFPPQASYDAGYRHMLQGREASPPDDHEQAAWYQQGWDAGLERSKELNRE